MIDVRILDQGAIVLFTPMSQAAQVWFDDSVEAAASQWLGVSLAVDHRYAQDLADALVGDGFTVEVE